MISFLSLFTGIGGFDLGLERAGMRCIGQVEKDKKCMAWLKHRWPEVKRVEDIKNVKGNEFGAVDLVCGGFPCQPHSNAGKKLRTRDDRYLWPEMLRVIHSIQPQPPEWVLGENVSAIDDSTDMVLDRTITDLESIGYEVGPPIEIPACSVGAPHERKRVFIVAHSNSTRLREQSIKKQRAGGKVINELNGSDGGGLWATPAARDCKGKNSAKHLSKERGHQDQLPNQVALWATPRAIYGEHPGMKDTSHLTGQIRNGSSVPTGKEEESRQLNPEFVRWLMGFPAGWLSCEGMETRLSRK